MPELLLLWFTLVFMGWLKRLNQTDDPDGTGDTGIKKIRVVRDRI
jgi:hypothetical protein